MTDANLADALRALQQYLDAIVCYASIMDEHEPNRLAFNARQALAAHDAQPSQVEPVKALCDLWRPSQDHRDVYLGPTSFLTKDVTP